MFVKYRKGQCRGMQNALAVIEEAHADWNRHVGRWHAPLIEPYRMEDARFALVTLGSMTGAAKDAVDEARGAGVSVGLVKVKTYRPFPLKAIAAALAPVEAVGVIDRSVDFGFDCGPLYKDVLGALAGLPRRIPARSFIGGLAGADITVGHVQRVIGEVAELAASGTPGPTAWLNERD